MGQVEGFLGNLQRVISIHPRGEPFRVLDFGGGDGTLGLALARRLAPSQAVDFTLVDYQRPDVSEQRERFTVSHERELEKVEGPFDLVLASAVLEHIPQLQPILKSLFEILAPGGWFYARTPWIAPLKCLFPDFDMTYPGHVHDLGAPFWNRVPVTFAQPLRIVVSRPSLVETNWLHQPGRTAAAWLMKLPARLELAVSPSPRCPWWRLVGGWEVVLQRSG
jgi:SAM-dependent methyltransferase